MFACELFQIVCFEQMNKTHNFRKIKPFCSHFCSFLVRMGIVRAKDFSFTFREEEPTSSEYQNVQQQLSKTKKRVKTLVSVIQAQNSLLTHLARKIDPGTEYSQLVVRDWDEEDSQAADDDDVHMVLDQSDEGILARRESTL